MKDWITTDSRNTPSTTNPEDEEILDAPGKEGNASMPEHVKRPNPWRKMMMMMMNNYDGEDDSYDNGGSDNNNRLLIISEQRRKYSKMDKRAKDKLVRSLRENGGG